MVSLILRTSCSVNMEINAVISNQYTSSQTRATWPRIVDYKKLVRTQELLDQSNGEDSRLKVRNDNDPEHYVRFYNFSMRPTLHNHCSRGGKTVNYQTWRFKKIVLDMCR